MIETDIKSLKTQIEELLNSPKFPDAKEYIEQYAMINPKDFDLLTYRCIFCLYSGSYEEALKLGKSGVKQYPTSGDAYYNLGCVYQCLDDLYNTVLYFEKASILYVLDNNKEKKDQLGLDQQLLILYKNLEERILNTQDPILVDQAQILLELRETAFGLSDMTFRSLTPTAGKYIFGSGNRRLMSCLYRFQYMDIYDETSLNPIQCKFEIMPVTESCEMTMGEEGCRYLIPIASKNNNTIHVFDNGDDQYRVIQRMNRHFNYYLVDGKYRVSSSDVSYFGRPVKLGHSPDRKRLILNIFVDGLSQTVLDKMGEIMPNTFRFFENGIICRRAYCTADWTYPSLAAYNTARYTPNHMMFHSDYDTQLPEDVTTLAEYFEKNGYFTSKMDGDWRSTANYGYDRGYRQLIYQSQLNASKCESMIGEAIDHMEAFSETDQFLWLCMGDLHDIADEYDLTLAAQTHIPINMCTVDNIGRTSVKQPYSLKKKYAYEKLISHIDCLLGALYQYIEVHYDPKDVVVSLFADHGQGFLIKENEHFMSEGRSNVAFMFKAGNCNEGFIDEIVSTCDYIPIMCRLANIELNKTDIIDGQLPAFLGGDALREYVISESIHPGDPYQAVIHDKDHCVYVKTTSKVENDGRFSLDGLDIFVADQEGLPVDAQDVISKYRKILMDHIAPLIIY